MKKSFLLITLLSALSFGLCAQTSFTGKPIYEILTKRAGDTLGTITVELFPAIAPLHVSNFDSLVSYQFYDSTAFHRVIPGFMIQGGDPNSRSGPVSTWGYGDPSQPTVPAEFSAAKHLRGTLSAARDTDINSANSQFFICVAPASWLNGQYSVYGKVTAGMDVVDTIVSAPRDSVDNPLQKIEMFISYLGSNDTIPQAPLLNLPVSNSFGSSSSRSLKWFAVSDAVMYHVQVSTDSLFSTLFKSVDVGTNSSSVTALSPATTYYWRVNTNNGGHISEWSDVWNFTVSGVGIEDQEASEVVSLFPNPGSGEFRFSGLEKGSTILIRDISGRVILNAEAKDNSCSIDLSGKAKGIYFYSILVMNRELQVGKLILK